MTGRSESRSNKWFSLGTNIQIVSVKKFDTWFIIYMSKHENQSNVFVETLHQNKYMYQELITKIVHVSKDDMMSTHHNVDNNHTHNE